MAVNPAVVKAVIAVATDKRTWKVIGVLLVTLFFMIAAPLFIFMSLLSSGANMDALNQEAIISGMPSEYKQQFEESQAVLAKIVETFDKNGLAETQVKMAKAIYLSCLTGKEKDNESFYQSLADCFNTSDTDKILSNVSATFSVEISDADKIYFKNLYGG